MQKKRVLTKVAVCVICGAEFLKDGQSITCSAECRRLRHNQRCLKNNKTYLKKRPELVRAWWEHCKRFYESNPDFARERARERTRERHERFKNDPEYLASRREAQRRWFRKRDKKKYNESRRKWIQRRKAEQMAIGLLSMERDMNALANNQPQ